MHVKSFRAVALAGLWSAVPMTAFAHGVEAGGIEQAPLWFTQTLFLFAWLAYAVGASRRRPASGARAVFHGAMLITGIALFGPLDEMAESSAAWHMVQHMLLIAVVAPLLVLARPLPQWRAVFGARIDRLWRGLHRASRRPMACALVHGLAIWFWHAPGPYVAALEVPLWHVLEHASFLFSGWLFWWSVLRPGRAGTLASAGALLLTATHTGMLGALLVFAEGPLYSAAQSALADQQMAGLLMWVPGGFVYLLVAAWAAFRWLGSPPQPGADAEGSGIDAAGSAAGTGSAPGSGAGVVVSVFGPSTRQITLPTSSATSNAPLRSMATPTGRPSALPLSSRKPVSTSTGGPLGRASEKGT